MSHELHCNQRKLQVTTLYIEVIYITGTFGEVCNAVSTSFHQTAAALQHNTNCLTLTDTATYHCWVFPSYDVCLSLSLLFPLFNLSLVSVVVLNYQTYPTTHPGLV